LIEAKELKTVLEKKQEEFRKKELVLEAKQVQIMAIKERKILDAFEASGSQNLSKKKVSFRELLILR